MMYTKLKELLSRIRPLDETAVSEAATHLDRLTKPPGSLGRLELVAQQLSGITGELLPELGKKAVIVMAGDHGVCEEGVSAFPAEVTPQMVLNFLNGGAAVNVLARHGGAQVFCVDVGVNADLSPQPGLISRKVRKGTANIAKGPAMTEGEALEAIFAGVHVVEDLLVQGYGLFACGEMGIGNTTPSSALMAAILGIEPKLTVGRGTGIDDSRWLHKCEVVERAVRINAPYTDNSVATLARLGGLEIAGLTGVILAAAANRRPVVIDGFISTAAALVAARISPESVPYMIASHQSQEPGHALLLSAISLSPMLHMDMRLGEGTGAVLTFHLIEAACKIMREMATFDSAGISGS